ncbi:MAG: acetyltransferase [Bryobacterales bacterium]|nr:acetyltransferase [Bryobacterales bacterium]
MVIVVRSSIVAGILLTGAPWACAQLLMTGNGPGGQVRMFNTDMAVLEMQEVRKDLPCVVTPAKPILGFDLKFHAGYEVSFPLRELSGSENLLTIVFRVTPESKKDDPIYFTQRVRVPSIEEDAKGDAYLHGQFDVGEGKYKVDWLMRDRAERVCSFYWDSEAQLPAKDKQIALNVLPETASPAEVEQFRDEPPVERDQTVPLNVKVLINFAPQNARSATLQPLDTSALVSILRTISRDPRIQKFTIVAFNLQEQRIVYRQEEGDKIDFPKLGDALTSLKLGTIDFAKLANKQGETEFLTGLIKSEAAGEKHPDALIFAGPKAMLDANIAQENLKEVGEPGFPVFYLNYNLNPQQTPWRDTIGHAVRFFKGQEYTISKPRDLWFAVSEIVSRIVKSKQGKQLRSASGN